MSLKNTKIVAAVGLTFLASPAVSQDLPLTVSGQFEYSLRNYLQDGLYIGQSDAGTAFNLGVQLNADLDVGPGSATLQYRGFFDKENGRHFNNLQKAYYLTNIGSGDLLIGFNIEDWSVSESSSLVNVLNAQNEAESVSSGDLIGTPMINANFNTGFGSLSAYITFGEVYDNFGDGNSRGRSPLFTQEDRAFYEADDKPDFALRWANNYTLGNGALDLSASVYNGTSRDAVGLPGCVNSVGTITEAVCSGINNAIVSAYENGVGPSGDDAGTGFFDLIDTIDPAILTAVSAIPGFGFVPYYQEIRQIGATAVYSQGNSQLRFEGIYRETSQGDFFAAIVGGEHTFNQFAGGEGDLTFALEYHYDDSDIRQPTNVFENDVFLGANYSMNDVKDTRLQAGVFYDLDTSAKLFNFGLSTRVTDSMRAELNGVSVEADGFNDPLGFIANDNFLELKITSFF